MSFSKRSDNAFVCYTKPLDSLKNWNDHFFRVDDFACPASFLWHTAKQVTRDPALVAADFNAQDYATLVAHPSPFRKSPEAFLCLNEGEARLLDTTIGRTILLLLVAPGHAESELEASVERLFDEDGSGNQTEQGDSVGGGQDANIQPVVEASDTVVEDVVLVQPRRQGKRKSMIIDAGGASHPPKKLREDHGTPSGTSVGGKSRSAIKRLLVGDVLNAKVEAKVDSLVRSSVSIMTIVTSITSTVDPASVAKEKPVKPSLFCADSSSAGGTDPNTGVFSDLTGSDFLVGAICTVINPDTDLQKFFASVHRMEHDQLFTEFNVGAARQMSLSAEVRMCAKYNVKKKRRLKSVVDRQVELLKVREVEIENLKAQLLLRETEAAEAIRLYAEASNFEIVKKYLRDEMNTLKEHNAILKKEQNALDVKVTDLEASAVSKERKLTDLNALVTSVMSQNDNLADRVCELEISSSGLQEKITVYENCMEQLEKFQDDQMKVVNDKFDKLYTNFVEMALHLEENFYPHLLTTISGRRWLYTHGMELAIVNCLNSPEYLSALRAAIGKAIEKGMQDGLSARITHGKEGRLQNVNFSLLARLKSNKDDSVKTVMDILHLEGTLAEKLGLNELQPNVDQLMVPIHSSPDKVVVGATALSLALDVSSVRVRKIRENIANQRSALRDVFVPLAEPFFAAVLIDMEGTSDIVPATTDTNTVLSITFASASSIAPISVDDYEVVGVDDQAVADGDASSFPNVDDAELNIPQ
ncbi:hypothetical protein Tco_0189051 [Tanacetum coccineum]